MVGRKWRVRLGAAAELDFANILKWTTENFGARRAGERSERPARQLYIVRAPDTRPEPGLIGARQSRLYRDTLVQAIGELGNGPDVAGSKARDEILRGVRTLHVARHGRRGRHFLPYRVAPGRIIEIGRILHDRMDLQRHLPIAGDESSE